MVLVIQIALGIVLSGRRAAIPPGLDHAPAVS